MRLLCPISSHKEMLLFFIQVGNYHCVAVISFRGKIAYYGLGKLAKMGSVPHLRRVVGHFILCVYLGCVEWPWFVRMLRSLCKNFLNSNGLIT